MKRLAFLNQPFFFSFKSGLTGEYMGKKLTIEYVRDIIENKGYKLVSKEYSNNKSNLEIECLRHGVFDMPYSSFSRGCGCPLCGYEQISKKLTHSVEHVRHNIETCGKGYKLISQDYSNTYSKLEIECPRHGVFEIKYRDFQQGCGCLLCGSENRSKAQKHSIEHIQAEINKTEEMLVSTKYTNSKTKLEFECQHGHRYLSTWNNFRSGNRCPACAEYGFNSDKPATLYYLEIKHRGRFYYKIGVTNREVVKRYSPSDLAKIAVIGEWNYRHGKDARDEEQRIIDANGGIYLTDKLVRLPAVADLQTIIYPEDGDYEIYHFASISTELWCIM